ncbi:MAG: bifunctional (p)ppGpp synthetase/guanosine-3',5'-bis(diphosphate) 3'-pyrophosphohydrolase, partial [Acidimicrobiia bacterium]|nr:bifunctional (p)ppGpp synthetase/guanosine-3',5'-bis(diphosphate) 3'-pyrophosphohydrolase [Acidimicrobiia bacterium]
LKSGDIVEITTSNSADAAPSRDWLQFTVTNRAISKIRQHFNRERRDEAQSNGKETVMKAIAKLGLGLTSAARDKALAAVAEDLSYADIDMLFVAVGEGNVAASTVANRLLRQVEPAEDDDGGGNLLDPIRPARPQPGPSIIVEGATDVMVRIAKCCAPVPGDEIEGFVTVGRGVSVHRSDCTNLNSLNERSDRMIDVSWAADRIGRFAVWIQVEALDRPWLLRDVTEVLSQLDANIYASSSGTNAERVAILRYEVEFSDPGQLERALKALRGVDGVFEAYRLRT